MKDFGKRDKQARRVAWFNGWLVLCLLTPMTLLFGLNELLAAPSWQTIGVALLLPLFSAGSALWAIRWGQGKC